MIDMPPEPPPAYEQVIAHKLVQCGLNAGHLAVKYEDYLQSIEIVIDPQAGATPDKFDCIIDAAGHEIVRFEDGDMQQAYSRQSYERVRPQMLADARNDLEKRGLLAGFPERSQFASDMLFAQALERHCGMKPGSFFRVMGDELIGQPAADMPGTTEMDRLSCLMAAIMFVSAQDESFKFGFIGNEAYAPDQ